MDKKRMRNDMLSELKKMTTQEYTQKSQMIKDQLLQLEEFQRAKTIGLTISRFPEVDTRPIIEAAWARGKQVAIPKCNPATRGMDFRILKSYEQLEIVYNDLLEPIEGETASVKQNEIDIQIVPGVIFSGKGYRIGYGGGYYDRYMVGFSGDSLSVAFNAQTKHIVPIESHDIPVEKIITENSIIDCKKG